MRITDKFDPKKLGFIPVKNDVRTEGDFKVLANYEMFIDEGLLHIAKLKYLRPKMHVYKFPVAWTLWFNGVEITEWDAKNSFKEFFNYIEQERKWIDDAWIFDLLHRTFKVNSVMKS